MATATVGQDGTVVLPETVGREAGLKPGDEIEFRVDRRGRIVGTARLLEVPKTRSITDLFGMLGTPARHLTVEEMNEVIRRRGAGL